MTFLTGTRKLFTTLGVAGALAVALSAPASAATTFGADVSAPPTLIPGACPAIGPSSPVCTYVPSYIVAPSSGVIVRWRVHTAAIGGSPGKLAPRVFRDAGIAGLTAIATGSRVAINASGVTVTPTRLPIQAGDRFGLDVGEPTGPNNPTVPAMFLTTGPGGDYFKPGPLDGSTTIGASYGVYLIANADVEPDADGDGYGDESQDNCASDASRQTACAATVPAATCKVPKLKGLNKSKAKAALVKAGCKLGKTSKKKSKKGKRGRATTQSPAAGKVVAAGTAVKLTLKK